MTHAPSIEITGMLRAWTQGDKESLNKLAPLVYAELRRMARNYMRRERPGQTLQTTALVHEAYLRLVDATQVQWNDRVHFFAVSAQMMRRILVDLARARGSVKRGGHERLVDLDKAPELSCKRARELVALDEALDILAGIDPRKAQVIDLRYFGGLSVEETAGILKISPQSVMRDWRLAKAFLMRELGVGSGQS